MTWLEGYDVVVKQRVDSLDWRRSAHVACTGKTGQRLCGGGQVDFGYYARTVKPYDLALDLI